MRFITGILITGGMLLLAMTVAAAIGDDSEQALRWTVQIATVVCIGGVVMAFTLFGPVMDYKAWMQLAAIGMVANCGWLQLPEVVGVYSLLAWLGLALTFAVSVFVYTTEHYPG